MNLRFRKMTARQSADAQALLQTFLREDEHYLDSSAAYGDAGPKALSRAIALFLRRPELGFVWLAYADGKPAGCCVVCYAVSTSMGKVVGKLDDVFVAAGYRGKGVGTEDAQGAQGGAQEKEDRPHRHGGAQGQSGCGAVLQEAGVQGAGGGEAGVVL